MYLLLSERQINGTIFQYCLSQNLLLTYVEFMLVKTHMTGSVWKRDLLERAQRRPRGHSEAGAPLLGAEGAGGAQPKGEWLQTKREI